jgi:hypothetical protein
MQQLPSQESWTSSDHLADAGVIDDDHYGALLLLLSWVVTARRPTFVWKQRLAR